MSKTAAAASDTPAFDLKGSTFPLLVLHLYRSDLDAIEQQIHARMLRAPDLFRHDPVVLELSRLQHAPGIPDFAGIADILQRHKLALAGVMGGSEAHTAAAQAAGLGLFNGSARAAGRPRPEEPEPAAEPPAEPPAAAASEPARPAKIVTSPVRTGQQVYAQGGDLIVLAPVSAGAEVLADGNIHVYASLRGRALAGARGDAAARIFVRSMEAELLSIAGAYRVINEQLSQEMRGKSVQAYLHGEQLRIEPIA